VTDTGTTRSLHPWSNPRPFSFELEKLAADYLWGKGLEYVLELASFMYEVEY
jgi:hypothetical protein